MTANPDTILAFGTLVSAVLSGFLIGRLVLWGDVARVTRRLNARLGALEEREAALLVLERREWIRQEHAE